MSSHRLAVIAVSDTTRSEAVDEAAVATLSAHLGGDAEARLTRFEQAGVDIHALAHQRQREGAQSFVTSWQRLLQRIEGKSAALADR